MHSWVQLHITPTYDSAQSIYLDIAKQCDSAVMLNEFSFCHRITFQRIIAMFGGSNTLWIQFRQYIKATHTHAPDPDAWPGCIYYCGNC